VRRRIDEEKMRRREVHAWWWKTIVIPVITALVGLVGALTGLVALLRKHSGSEWFYKPSSRKTFSSSGVKIAPPTRFDSSNVHKNRIRLRM
jgi:hypothetical protein